MDQGMSISDDYKKHMRKTSCNTMLFKNKHFFTTMFGEKWSRSKPSYAWTYDYTVVMFFYFTYL